MKLHIKQILLGFVATFVPLAVLDYILHFAFLDSSGFITNSIVGDVIDYQLTYFAVFWSGLAAVLIAVVLLVNDYVARKRQRYTLKNNTRFLSACIGVVATAVLLIVPLLRPDDYQRVIGPVVIFITLLVLRHRLITRR